MFMVDTQLVSKVTYTTNNVCGRVMYLQVRKGKKKIERGKKHKSEIVRVTRSRTLAGCVEEKKTDSEVVTKNRKKKLEKKESPQ